MTIMSPHLHHWCIPQPKNYETTNFGHVLEFILRHKLRCCINTLGGVIINSFGGMPWLKSQHTSSFVEAISLNTS